jgi:hypothetical protein
MRGCVLVTAGGLLAAAALADSLAALLALLALAGLRMPPRQQVLPRLTNTSLLLRRSVGN